MHLRTIAPPLAAVPVLIVLCCAAARTKATSADATAPADWTVMVFMNGDNNLEPFALDNFEEMARVGSTARVQMVVQLDRIGIYSRGRPSPSLWTQTLRFLVKPGTKAEPKHALQDIGEANMGDPRTLRDFVRWAMSTYPAKHYALIIWDHGQGYRAIQTAAGSKQVGDPFRSSEVAPFRSVSYDETDDDQLYVAEIQTALEQALQGRKLDVIGFDACLMAMVEVAYALRSYAHVMIGSEDLEPGEGWRYDDWLAELVAKPGLDAAGLGRALVDSYRRRWSGNGDERDDARTTLSAIALTNIDQVASSVSALADSLGASIEENLDAVDQVRSACRNFAPGTPRQPGRFYHVDARCITKGLAVQAKTPAVRAAAGAADAALRGAILAAYAGAERGANFGTSGLAIYFARSATEYRNDPYSEHGYDKDNQRYPVAFVKEQRWSDFLHKYWSKRP